jgi:hypothetical protein
MPTLFRRLDEPGEFRVITICENGKPVQRAVWVPAKNWNPDDGGNYDDPIKERPQPDKAGCLYIFMVGLFLLVVFVALFFA